MEAIGELGGLDLESDKPLSEVVDGYTYFENGDVLIAKITPCFENGKGALPRSLTSGVGFGTTELHVLRPGDDIDERFLFYLTISDHFRKLGEASMYGAAGQKRVPEEFVFGFRHPLPSLPEQRGIANFLDRSTSRIDRLIDKKEHLIELLEERRTALIAKAVTKGLDPEAPMKDSGVEWLGEIRKDWDTTKIGHHVDLINGFPFSSEHFSNSDGIPLIRIRDLGNESTEAYFRGKPDTDFRVQSGDIVIGMDGDFEVDRWSGKPALLNQRLCCLKTHDSLDKRFLYYSLPAPLDVINDLTHSTTVKHLSSKQVRRIEICYPPLEVQRKIGEKLEVEMANLDRLAERIRRAIERLQKYRSALITAAVTGKIDVRDHAA